MKSKVYKKELVKMKDTSFTSVSLESTTYDNYRFEVIVKNGTSRHSYFFHDYSLAEMMFDQKLEEIKKGEA